MTYPFLRPNDYGTSSFAIQRPLRPFFFFPEINRSAALCPGPTPTFKEVFEAINVM